jgi:predicted Zn-ribbon and HTH transcriptional regulator
MVYFILKIIFWKVQSKERQLLLFPFLCSKCSFSFLLQCVIWWSISQFYLKQKCCWKSTKQRKTTLVISVLLFEVLLFFSFIFTPHNTMIQLIQYFQIYICLKVQNKERQVLLFPFFCSKCSFSFLLFNSSWHHVIYLIQYNSILSYNTMICIYAITSSVLD